MQRPDNFSTFKRLRNEFPFFSFEDYAFRITEKGLFIEYTFNLSDRYIFKPTVTVPYKNNIYRPIDRLSHEILDRLVFNAGMIELVSYWKAACPIHVIIKPGCLFQDQVKFWKKTYYQGLGEFFYLNSILTSEEEFMEIDARQDKKISLVHPGLSAGGIVPVGGGKDSVVSMELLNGSGADWLPMAINPGKATKAVINAANKRPEETIEFYREIDPQLIKLNQEGFLNGHTPFSALLAFYSLIAAYLSGRKDIILSNESSANEATVPGTNINHQYSKSLEFEKDFRDFVSGFISEEFNYFSFLRPISELQIAGLFAGMKNYHAGFRSCNVGSKTGSWCGHCPKCLFTFIILSPFLKPDELVEIFGKNLLEDLSLAHILEELTGIIEVKPFECIGTVDEVNLAFSVAKDMYPEDKMPALIRSYPQLVENKKISEEKFKDLLKSFNPGHFLTGPYFNILTAAIR